MDSKTKKQYEKVMNQEITKNDMKGSLMAFIWETDAKIAQEQKIGSYNKQI